MALKQAILIRQDLKLPKGKMAVQAAHASVDAVIKSDQKKVREWLSEGGKKVALKVENEKELFSCKQMAEREKLVTALIKDAGKTTIAPGTITCLGIGPDEEQKIDRITGKLKMM